MSALSMEFIDVGLHLPIELDCLPDSHFQGFRSTAMSPSPSNFVRDGSDLTHEGSLLAPDVSKVAQRPVMEPVHLVDSIHAPLLDHQLSPRDGAFFRWLEKQSHFFVVGDGADCLQEERDEADKAGHMSVVPAHVSCPLVFGDIGETLIEFEH